MIGVFDSGRGGLNALREIRRLAPMADVCFYADRKNAPYGTKSKGELVELVLRDAALLSSNGATRILMACCTASTVYSLLPKQIRRICVPIIAPTARRAAGLTQNGRIGVIATEATVRSGAFTAELSRYRSVKEVFELPLQSLVSLIEGGANDSNASSTVRMEINRLLHPLYNKEIDTLILGCTHFPELEGEISRCFSGIKTVSSAREGAIEILKNISPDGSGRTVYI